MVFRPSNGLDASFASQVAALGITSSALFVAPLAAGLALAGTWRPTRQLTSRLAVGLSAYILIAAVTVRQGMVSTLQQFPQQGHCGHSI